MVGGGTVRYLGITTLKMWSRKSVVPEADLHMAYVLEQPCLWSEILQLR